MEEKDLQERTPSVAIGEQTDAARPDSGNETTRAFPVRDQTITEKTLQDVEQFEVFTVCRNPHCKGRVPVTTLRCVDCGRLAGSKGRRLARPGAVEKILEELLDEYAPASTVLREMCSQLAAALVEVRLTPVGTKKHQALIDLIHQLGAQLEASRVPAAKTPAIDASVTVEQLRQRAAFLLEFATKCGAPPTKTDTTPSATAAVPAVEPTPTPPTTPAPTPEPVCSYCGQKCVGPAHDAYGTLHFADPIEVQRRDAEATKVMMKMVGRGTPN